jgi:pilus assembly protein Flp/PilA
MRFLSDESGATSIEYALIASLISVFIIGAVTLLSGRMQTMFNYVAAQFPG